MQIAVLGTGNMGSALAAAFSRAGHTVRVGSRDEARGRTTADALGATSGGTVAQAVAGSDVVVLAVAFDAVADTMKATGGLDGTIVVDITNPLSADYQGLSVAADDSAGETVARLAPSARVVKAFNNLGPAVIDLPPKQPWSVFVAGDDQAANETVAGLVRDIGLEPVPSGPLSSSRFLEAALVAVIRMRVALGLPFSPHPGIGLVLRSTEVLPGLPGATGHVAIQPPLGA